MLEIEKGNARSFSVKNPLWKGLWNSHKTDNGMINCKASLFGKTIFETYIKLFSVLFSILTRVEREIFIRFLVGQPTT
jgi:hypothetical protein